MIGVFDSLPARRLAFTAHCCSLVALLTAGNVGVGGFVAASYARVVPKYVERDGELGFTFSNLLLSWNLCVQNKIAVVFKFMRVQPYY